MTSATLFSGIGAPEVAMPHWDWRWHAEIEKFPSAVMAIRHGASVNVGDVTAYDFVERAEAIGRPDILVFGSPCQSYSVAGQRLGLDDPRGNLALIALGIVSRLRPTWFVFENVPGLFSSWSGGPQDLADVDAGLTGESDTVTSEFVESSDFAAFLSGVSDIGYQSAWTVLDAQFAGLAQRRDRVFVVGHPRDWRRAAAVLLEPESLCGHPPTRGEARETDPTLPSRSSAGGGLGADFDCDGGLVAPPHFDVSQRGSDGADRCRERDADPDRGFL